MDTLIVVLIVVEIVVAAAAGWFFRRGKQQLNRTLSFTRREVNKLHRFQKSLQDDQKRLQDSCHEHNESVNIFREQNRRQLEVLITYNARLKDDIEVVVTRAQRQMCDHELTNYRQFQKQIDDNIDDLEHYYFIEYGRHYLLSTHLQQYGDHGKN